MLISINTIPFFPHFSQERHLMRPLQKSHKLDNLFTVIDNTTDVVASISDKAVGLIVNGIAGLFSKIGKKKGDNENEE